MAANRTFITLFTAFQFRWLWASCWISSQAKAEKSAIPTVFPNYPAHLQPKPKKSRQLPKIRIIQQKQKVRKVNLLERSKKQILEEHSYSESNGILKAKLKKAEQLLTKYRLQIKSMKKTLLVRKQRSTNLKEIVAKLKTKGTGCIKNTF